MTRMRVHQIVAVLVVALVLVVSGCAREVPGSPHRQASTTSVASIPPTALILDASDSMLTADAPGKRIDAAKSAATGLVEAVPAGSKLAVLAYGAGTGNSPAEHAAGCQDITTLVPLGDADRANATAAINRLTPRGFTPIAEALTRAAGVLPKQGEASIVLVSDGEDTCGKPPCPVARSLVQAHPQLQISTVGFRTDGAASAELRCIADASDGLFVGAANSAQLRARLLATAGSGDPAPSITGGALAGIDLGTPLTEVRKQHNGFPAGGRRDGDSTIIVWHDCDWVFGSEGTLTEIRPHSGRTIDGITIGSSFADVTRYYGSPITQEKPADGATTYTFDADPSSDAGYRITFSGTGDEAQVTRIIVCGCAPRAKAAANGPASEVLRPVTRTGATTTGWLKDTTKNSGGYFECSLTSVPGVVDAGLYWCSGSSGSDQGVCAKSFDGKSMLCVTDVNRKTLTLFTPSTPVNFKTKAMSPNMPLQLALDGGITCTYSAVRGFPVNNSTDPSAQTRYNCGGVGNNATYVWSKGDADPISRGTTWTVPYGKADSTPLRSLAVTKVTYVGFGE